jgi:hypothetical protein
VNEKKAVEDASEERDTNEGEDEGEDAGEDAGEDRRTRQCHMKRMKRRRKE